MERIGITFVVILCITTIFFVLYVFKKEQFHDVGALFYDPIATLTPQEKQDSLYSPFIIRPREINAQRFSGRCSNELYPNGYHIGFTNKVAKGEMGSPNASVEAQFYAQRPLLNPDQYYNMLSQMLKTVNSYHNVPDFIPKDLFIHQTEFSDGNTFSNVMKYIMKLINKAKTATPSLEEYAKVDTWGGEQFAFTDQKMFSFSRYDEMNRENGGISGAQAEQDRAKNARRSGEPRKLVVNFNLYNTLRNISTDVIATVYFAHGKYYFDNIELTTKKETCPWTPVNFGTKSGNINLNNASARAPVPNWIYGNTLENQTFNNKGFHSSNEEENILIKGGIPEEYRQFIKQDNVKNSYWTKYYNAQDLPGGPLFPETSTSKLNTKILPKLPNRTNSKLVSWTVNV